MAMGAQCTITNDTGSNIVFSSVGQVNDDSTWSVNPAPGTVIADGGTCVISMGNRSVFPRGVGFNAQFVAPSLKTGGIYLDDPAVGAHHFDFSGDYNYKATNPSSNNYYVTITAK